MPKYKEVSMQKIILAFVVGLLPLVVSAQAYKCKSPNGTMVFSDAPCRDGATVERYQGAEYVPQGQQGSSTNNYGGASADACLRRVESLGLSAPRLAKATTGCYQGARSGVDKRSAEECARRVEGMGVAGVRAANAIVECYGGTVKESSDAPSNDRWQPYR